MVLKNDNFDDNVLDTSFWQPHLYDMGSIIEQNERLECTCSTDPNHNNDYAGVITKEKHSLSTSSTQVSIGGQYGPIKAELIGLFVLNAIPAPNPIDTDILGYCIYKSSKYMENGMPIVRVRRCIDSVYHWYSFSGSGFDNPPTWYSHSNSGTVGIRVENGIINFYDDGFLLSGPSMLDPLPADLPFDLAEDLHVLLVYTNTGDATRFGGMNYFDNFLAVQVQTVRLTVDSDPITNVPFGVGEYGIMRIPFKVTRRK